MALGNKRILYLVLALHKHNGRTSIDKHQKTVLKYLAPKMISRRRPLLFPASPCRGCFRTPFREIFLIFSAKTECLSVQTRSRTLLKSDTCSRFISLMFGHLPNTSLTWDSALFLLDASRASIWTFLLDIDRFSSCIFVASFTAVVNTRNTTVTFLPFNSGAQFKYGNPELCQLSGFGCVKLDHPLLPFL